MSIIIALACLLIAFIGGIVSARVTNVLNSGKAIAVGTIAGIILAAVAFFLVGALGAGAALVGAIAGSIAYFLVTALIVGGC